MIVAHARLEDACCEFLLGKLHVSVYPRVFKTMVVADTSISFCIPCSGDLWQTVCGPRGGCVELRCCALRPAVWLVAIRRREHTDPLQEDQGI